MTKSRGVRGAAGGCAVASLVYLLVRGLLTLLVSALMGLAHPGASLAKPLGFSGVSTALFQLLIGLGAIVLTLVFLLKVTRLKTKDLRIMLPAPWSPGFCLPVFLGVANLANLAGALINRLTGSPATSEMLPSGGPELLVQFLALCVMPAIAEELLFRGAFQGLMRPCGSAAAIFAPALLFGVLHLDLAQGLTAFACGVFLGWLAERSGSILPGMLLHLVNNALAFLTIYLRYYAPAEVSFGVELFILRDRDCKLPEIATGNLHGHIKYTSFNTIESACSLYFLLLIPDTISMIVFDFTHRALQNLSIFYLEFPR